jgi:hypothetical protein
MWIVSSYLVASLRPFTAVVQSVRANPMSKRQVLFLTVILAFVIVETKGTPQEEAIAVNGLMMSVSHDDTR